MIHSQESGQDPGFYFHILDAILKKYRQWGNIKTFPGITMDNHIPYEERVKRKADFRVKYRFYSEEEGGRYSLPFQGIRSDFWYEHPEHKQNAQSLFVIWPEFEDEKGEVIVDKTLPVPERGTARMWIINDDFIQYHKGKIGIGTKGFFKEGSKSTGECEVVELINIAE